MNLFNDCYAAQASQVRGTQKLMGDSLKVVWAEFLTLSKAAFALSAFEVLRVDTFAGKQLLQMSNFIKC